MLILILINDITVQDITGDSNHFHDTVMTVKLIMISSTDYTSKIIQTIILHLIYTYIYSLLYIYICDFGPGIDYDNHIVAHL